MPICHDLWQNSFENLQAYHGVKVMVRNRPPQRAFKTLKVGCFVWLQAPRTLVKGILWVEYLMIFKE